MPIYEFKCDRCGKEFEEVVYTSTIDRVTCPQCGAKETRKLISVFSSCRPSKDGGSYCSTRSSST
jgi:putative FmdB family regulatory protein